MSQHLPVTCWVLRDPSLNLPLEQVPVYGVGGGGWLKGGATAKAELGDLETRTEQSRKTGAIVLRLQIGG